MCNVMIMSKKTYYFFKVNALAKLGLHVGVRFLLCISHPTDLTFLLMSLLLT